MRKRIFAALLLLLVVVLGIALWRNNDASTDQVADDQIKAADAGVADPAAVKRGAYVAIAADCAACHSKPGSTAAFAGGYALETPFGALVSSNITPDRQTGIGDWTERDFFRAVRHGRGKDGYLYAAMPYNAYVKLSDEDMHDLWAYMRTVKPVSNAVVSDQLPFPFSIRWVNLGWNLLFFDNRSFRPDASKSAQWNRGAYLVQGPEHCAACHSPKNLLGGDKAGEYLQGGSLQGWFAPEIAGNPQLGLGQWSGAQIIQYLKTGSNDRSVASGPMAEAVEHSTQHLTDADLAAIAVYLKTVPGSSAAAAQPLAADAAQMLRGKHVYDVSCSACHNTRGQGVEGMVTGFADNPGTRAPSADSLISTVLKGGRAAETETNPTGAGMPSFAWKLGDADIAAVLTYVRNSWGNAAAPVTVAQVKAARQQYHAPQALGSP